MSQPIIANRPGSSVVDASNVRSTTPIPLAASESMSQPKIQLFVNFKDTQLPVLTIPVQDCNRFALRPLKWLRFLGYTIYGCEGHISTSPNGPNVDYESPVHAGSSYYFKSTDEPRYLDVRCIYDKTSSAHSTESRVGFREALEERDGTCIITDQPAIVCEAAHYYPHSKGSEYLSRVMEIRGGPPDLTDINDIRNGLFLLVNIQKYFGLGIVGFLKTPNFALSGEDIPPSPGPICGPQSNTPGRFILQHFIQQSDVAATTLYPHNQNARQPANMNDFPPPVLIDMWYGCAALKQWGDASTSNTIWSFMEPRYYHDIGLGGEGPSGDDDLGDDSNNDHPNQPEEQVLKRAIRAEKRANRVQSRSHLGTMEDALDILMILSRKPEYRYQDDQPSMEEENLSRDRVNKWLQAQ